MLTTIQTVPSTPNSLAWPMCVQAVHANPHHAHSTTCVMCTHHQCSSSSQKTINVDRRDSKQATAKHSCSLLAGRRQALLASTVLAQQLASLALSWEPVGAASVAQAAVQHSQQHAQLLSSCLSVADIQADYDRWGCVA